jgi:hypothetical protein
LKHSQLNGSNLHNARINIIHGNPNILHTPSTFSGETVIDVDTNSFFVSTVTGTSSTGYIVTWNTLTSGAPSMSVLTDVDLTGLADNNILRYNSATEKWEVSTDVAALSGLTDVDVSTIVNGNTLVYNSSTGKYYPGDGPSTKRNNVDNSGIYTTPSFVNNGDGSITIGVGVYNLYHTADFSGNIYQHTINGNTFVLENNKTNYILASYNNGNPLIYVTSSMPAPYSYLSPILTIYREGTELYQLNWNDQGKGLINKITYQSIRVDRFQIEPDEVLLSTSGKKILLTGGTVWRGGISTEISSFNSSTGTVDYFYHVGGVWTKTNAMPDTSTGCYVTKWYDDGTDLVELTADDHCAINWVYRAVGSSENCIAIILGKRDYTLSRTQISQPIDNLPDLINNFFVLIGRIIVRKDNSITPIVDEKAKPLFLSQSFVENVDAINVESAERNSTGLISGGVLSYNSGNSFSISSGVGYLSNKITETDTRITWDTFPDVRAVNGNGINYFAVGADGTYVVQATVPDTNLYIYVGACFMTFNNTQLVGLVANPTYVDDYQKRMDDLLTGAVRTLVESGLKVSEGVTPLTLSVSAGWINTRLQRIEFPAPLTSFTKLFYTTNYGWLPNPYFPNIVDVYYWNDMTQAYPGGLTLMTPGYWKKDAVFAMPNGQVYYVYGEAEYATQALALASPLPAIPATTGPALMILAFICCQRGDSSIENRIADLRPYLQRVFGYEGKGVGDSIIHSSLLALDQDDHSGIYYNQTISNTKYAINDGKDGGQTLNGSINSGEELRLRNNAIDALGVDINADGSLTVNASNYHTLVTTDDVLPNKKYVDDLSAALIQKATDIDSTGLVSGGLIVLTGGITFTIKAGIGYINYNGVLTRVVWDDITDLQTAVNGQNYICMGTNPAGEGIPYVSAVQNPSSQYIELGYVFSGSANTVIVELISTPKYTAQLAERVNTYTIEGLRAIVEEGTTVAEQANPNELQLNIASGIIHVNLQQITLDPTTAFSKVYNTANYGWVPLATSSGYVNITQWNDVTKNYGAALITMTDGYWKKDLVFRVPNGHVYYILGQAEYSSEEEAKAAVLPTVPSNFSRVLVYLCTIVSQKNTASVGAGITDIRPYLPRIFGFGSSASGVTLSHSALSNLDYASSGHTGFEPTFNHGNFNVGSNKLSISGTSTGAVIGSGLTIDIVEANIDHNNLGSLNSGSYYHSDQAILKASSPEFADTLITSLPVDPILGNVAKSVESYITKAWDYNKAILTDTTAPMGFVNRTDSTITFDLPTLTFKIYGTFSFYVLGIKYNKIITIDSPETVALPANETGKYGFYYATSTGVAVLKCTAKDVFFDYASDTPVAVLYYNNSATSSPWAGPSALLLDRRHGIGMNTGTRNLVHSGLGTIVKGTGFDLNGTYSVATGTGGLIANSYGVDAGHILDEDMDFSLAILNDNAGSGAQYPIFYKIGTDEWRWYKNILPYHFGTNITYNKNTSGTFSLEEITTDNTYVNYYLCAINAANENSDYRFIWVMGQRDYTSLEAAQNKTFLDLDLSYLPFYSVAPLHQITMRRDSTYTATTGYARIEATINIIGTFASIAPTFNVQKHNTLAGRTTSNAHPAEAIYYNNTSTGLASDNVKGAIDKVVNVELPKYQATSAMVNYQATSAMGNYQLTANMTNYLGTNEVSNYQASSAMSNYQLVANSSLSLGTGAAASFVYTSASSLFQHTSATSLFQVVANSTLSLGTGAAASFVLTANQSLFQYVSNSGNSLGTGAAASFVYTSNQSLFQYVSNSGNSLGTGAAASFQYTSAMGNYQATSLMGNYFLTANSTNLMNTTERANYYDTAGHTFANSTHIHGAFTGINISATSASDGLQLSVANPGGVVNLSNFEPYNLYTGTSVSSFSPASYVFNTFNLPCYVAMIEINLAKSFNMVLASRTSVNSAGSNGWSLSQSFYLFKRSDYGANSSILSCITSASGAMSFSHTYSSVTNQALKVSMVTDSTGGLTTWSTQSASNAFTSYWTGRKQLPIPLVTTLGPGEYWVAHRVSSASNSSGSNATGFVLMSNLQVTLPTITIGSFGFAGTTNAIFNGFSPAKHGMGYASAITTNAAMNVTNISTNASNHLQYMVMKNY